MSKISYIPKDYNSVTPYLVIKGAAQAIEYYKKVFGATELFRMNGPDGTVGHAEIKIGNSHIMLADENPAMGEGHSSATTVGGSPISLYVYLPNVDQVVERAAARKQQQETSYPESSESKWDTAGAASDPSLPGMQAELSKMLGPTRPTAC